MLNKEKTYEVVGCEAHHLWALTASLVESLTTKVTHRRRQVSLAYRDPEKPRVIQDCKASITMLKAAEDGYCEFEAWVGSQVEPGDNHVIEGNLLILASNVSGTFRLVK